MPQCVVTHDIIFLWQLPIVGTAVYVTVSSLYHLTSLSFKQTMKFVYFSLFFSLSHSCRNKCALNNISVGTDGHLTIF